MVGGVQVTSDNVGNILGGDYPSASYDADSQTLTLRGLQYSDQNSYIPPTVVSRQAGSIYASRMRGDGYDVIKSLAFQYVPVNIASPVLVSMTSLDGATTYATGTLNDGLVVLTPTSQATLNDVCLSFTSDQPFSFVPMAVMTLPAETYGISVAGTDITEFNYSDVLGDGTVSYEIRSNTLTLTDAIIVPEMEASGIDYFGTQDLTIMLVGTSTISGMGGCGGIRYNGESERVPTLIFTTDEQATGQLICPEEYMFDGFTSIEYRNGLALRTAPDGQTIGSFAYDLWVNGTQVTIANKDNILGDKAKTMRFDNTTNTLTLKGVSAEVTFESKLPALTVYLIGSNTITNKSGHLH